MMHWAALGRTSEGEPERPRRLNNLGAALLARVSSLVMSEPKRIESYYATLSFTMTIDLLR